MNYSESDFTLPKTLSFAVSPYPSVLFIIFSQIWRRVGGGGRKPLFIMVTLLFTSAGDWCSQCTPGSQTSQNATGPRVPWQLLSAFYCLLPKHPRECTDTPPLVPTPSLHPQQLWLHSSSDRALMEMDWKRGEVFLDVGNKSDRPHRMRQSLIFFSPTEGCVHVEEFVFFFHPTSLSLFSTPPLHLSLSFLWQCR